MPMRDQKQQGQSHPARGRLSLKTTRLRQLTMEDLSKVHGGEEKGQEQVPLSPSWWCWWPF